LFLLKEPLLGCDHLGEEEELRVFKSCRKASRKYHADITKAKGNQVSADLRRKETHVAETEKREARALERFMAKRNYQVFHTVLDLQRELGKKHDTGVPMYTPAMKVEIVEAQIQYRRDCLLRKLRPGALCSSVSGSIRKLDALMDSFSIIIEDELRFPALLKPPEIRKTQQSHPFSNKARQTLDEERSMVTREMTRNFMDTYEGGVFLGWRCTIDYSRSYPLNPEALVGQRVAKLFESVEHFGTITRSSTKQHTLHIISTKAKSH